MPTHSPRISILIAAYEAEGFLEATLRSALAQTFMDHEVLVIDDGSSDGTAGLVRSVMADDPRLRLIVQPNRGLSATRNRGIRQARGELIAFLDHDDLWHPTKLAWQVACLDAHPEAAVVSCYTAVLDRCHLCLGWRLGGQANGDVYREMQEWDMVSGGSVVLVRRSALLAAGPFDETLRIREDWDQWIRLARLFRFVTVPKVLVGYVRGEANASLDYQRMAEEGVLVLEKVRRQDPQVSSPWLRFCRARDLFAVASFCTLDGHLPEAWSYLARSLFLSPVPVLRSPRRWALVVLLGLRTLLPPAAFRRLFALLNRLSVALPPGLPFNELSP